MNYQKDDNLEEDWIDDILINGSAESIDSNNKQNEKE